MNYFAFITEAVMLGMGLAMDAFSVSLANGLHEPAMKRSRMFLIAGTFAGFQFLMPMIGWLAVKTVMTLFAQLQRFTPLAALVLLCWIGGNMIHAGIHPNKETDSAQSASLSPSTLLLQGIATSIDALSVGFTIAGDSWAGALAASVIIGAVTFVICLAGLVIGRRAGTALAGSASIFGGVILIFIGFKIFFGF